MAVPTATRVDMAVAEATEPLLTATQEADLTAAVASEERQVIRCLI